MKALAKLFSSERWVYFLLLLTFLAYIPAINNTFQENWDDGKFITNNEFIKELSLPAVKKMFSFSLGIDYYHPLTTLSHAIIYRFAGLNPVPYHLLNIIFHLLNILLVYKFIRRLHSRPEIAAVVAMIFALHPMHVESVAWVVELKDVMYAFFYFASLLAYTKYLQEKNTRFFIYSALLFVLSCMAKPAAISLPVTLLALDLYMNRRLVLKDLVMKLPHFALAAFFAYTTIRLQGNVGALDMIPHFGMTDRLFMVCYSVMFYITRYFAPLGLSALHLYPEEGKTLPLVFFLAPLFLAALGYFLHRMKELRREIIFGACFFVCTTALMLQIVPAGMAIVSERYAYVSYVGLSFMFACIVAFLFNKAALKPYLQYLPLAIALVFIPYTYMRCKVWKDGVTLFTDVVKKEPGRDYPHYALGVAKGMKGDLVGAIASYNESIRLNARNAEAYNNRGNALQSQNRDYDASIADYDKALAIRPDYVNACFNRGTAKEMKKDLEGAVMDYYKTLELDPKYTKAYFALGNLHGAAGQDSIAVLHFTSAIILEPRSSEAYLKRGFAHYNLQQARQACADWQKAAELGNGEASQYLSQYCR